MGIINHNAIIATTWSQDAAREFNAWLLRYPNALCSSLESPCNGYVTFFIAPDGSKEGWEESDAGDRFRDTVIARLRQDDYDDGSSPWAWVEVGYGEYGQKVLRGNNHNIYNNNEYAEEVGGETK